jgi:cbb3-type cytochrome oxidase cytochrome c subunit
VLFQVVRTTLSKLIPQKKITKFILRKLAVLCCNGRVVSVLEGGYESYNQQQRATRASTAKFGTSVSNITIYISLLFELLYPQRSGALNRTTLANSALVHILNKSTSVKFVFHAMYPAQYKNLFKKYIFLEFFVPRVTIMII